MQRVDLKQREKETMQGEWQRQRRLYQLSRHQQQIRDGRLGNIGGGSSSSRDGDGSPGGSGGK